MRAAWSFVPLVLGACQHSAGTIDLPTTPVGQSDTLDQLVGREKTSDMARRVAATGVTVLAAVNADFFATSGENENNQVIGGE